MDRQRKRERCENELCSLLQTIRATVVCNEDVQRFGRPGVKLRNTALLTCWCNELVLGFPKKGNHIGWMVVLGVIPILIPQQVLGGTSCPHFQCCLDFEATHVKVSLGPAAERLS